MKSIIKNIAKLTLISLVSVSYAYAEIAVIVHPGNPVAELSQDEIKAIFLGKKQTFSTGSIAVPIVQKNEVGDAFSSSYLGKRPSQLTAYWSKLVFTGGGQPPKEVSSGGEMLKLISDNQNMIGFISSSEVTDAVKVVNKR